MPNIRQDYCLIHIFSWLWDVQLSVHVSGRELNATQQYAGVALLSIPIFLLAGAGSVIFWVLGASIFAVLLHAGFYQSDLADDELPFEVVMDKV